jgi:predicted enzyme related to lactoylglutathione lyase
VGGKVSIETWMFS